MSTIERRVTEALRTYGEGLDMTTQDIERLEAGLEPKQQAARSRRRSMVWQGAVAACAVTGVVLGALALANTREPSPQPAAPAPVTLTDLEGIWRVTHSQSTSGDDSEWLWRFTSDGFWLQSNSPDILTRTANADDTTVRPAPGGFVSTDPGEPAGCEVTWATSAAAEGVMQLTEKAQTSACTGNPPTGEVWSVTRISPRSTQGAAVSASFPAEAPERLVDSRKLTGTWLLKYRATLLTVDASGRYAVQDLGATTEPDTGTVTVRPTGTTTFTPEGGRRDGCVAAYESITYTNAEIVTRSAKGSCDRLGATTNDTWVRIN